MAFHRPLEVPQPSGTNSVMIQPVCHETINFTLPVRPQLDNASVAPNDGSASLNVSPTLSLQFGTCNLNVPAYGSVPSFVSTSVEAPDLRTRTFEPQILQMNADGVSGPKNFTPCQHCFVEASGDSYPEHEYGLSCHSIMNRYQVFDWTSGEADDFVAKEFSSNIPWDTENVSTRVPLYERTGVQSLSAVQGSSNISEIGCNNLSDSALDSEEGSNSSSQFISSLRSQDFDVNSSYSNTNTESSSFMIQSSPLYSMVSNVDDLKRAARGEGAEQLITISIEDCNLPSTDVSSSLVKNRENSSLGGLYFCGVPLFDLHAGKSVTLKENMEKVVVDMVASGLKFAVLAVRREHNLLQKLNGIASSGNYYDPTCENRDVFTFVNM